MKLSNSCKQASNMSLAIKVNSVWRLFRKEAETSGRETSEGGGSGYGEKWMDWRAM